MSFATHLRARYARLAHRERVIMALALVVVVIGIGYLLFIEPALSRRTLLERQVIGQRAEIGTFREAIVAATRDPNAPLREQLDLLRGQLRVTDKQFEQLQYGLVQPQHMGELLQSLLREHRGLQLLGLRTLPVIAIADPVGEPTRAGENAPAAPSAAASAPGSANEDAWLFRHSVEIKVQGGYADMIAYLRDIENLPRQVRWGGLEIDARRYPASVMTVTIYTVSLDRSWWIL